MPSVNDTQVRADLRTVMTKHKLDLSKTSFVCARGIVRMMGELRRQRAYASHPIHHTDVENLEQDLSKVRGVVRIHMDLKDWQREGGGQWRETAPPQRRTQRAEAPVEVDSSPEDVSSEILG